LCQHAHHCVCLLLPAAGRHPPATAGLLAPLLLPIPSASPAPPSLPPGKGLWGMMWMLPSGAACSATTSGCGRYGGWPASGEVDIVSSINDMMTVQVRAGGAASIVRVHMLVS